MRGGGREKGGEGCARDDTWDRRGERGPREDEQTSRRNCRGEAVFRRGTAAAGTGAAKRASIEERKRQARGRQGRGRGARGNPIEGVPGGGGGGGSRGPERPRAREAARVSVSPCPPPHFPTAAPPVPGGPGHPFLMAARDSSEGKVSTFVWLDRTERAPMPSQSSALDGRGPGSRSGSLRAWRAAEPARRRSGEVLAGRGEQRGAERERGDGDGEGDVRWEAGLHGNWGEGHGRREWTSGRRAAREVGPVEFVHLPPKRDNERAGHAWPPARDDVARRGKKKDRKAKEQRRKKKAMQGGGAGGGRRRQGARAAAGRGDGVREWREGWRVPGGAEGGGGEAGRAGPARPSAGAEAGGRGPGSSSLLPNGLPPAGKARGDDEGAKGTARRKEGQETRIKEWKDGLLTCAQGGTERGGRTTRTERKGAGKARL